MRPPIATMKILLIATNRHDRLLGRLEARPMPVGLAYVAGHLDDKRHTLKILDLMFSTDYLAETDMAAREFEPDLIGLSIRNLDNQSYINTRWALPVTAEVIQHLRAVTRAPIVCGGPAFSILPTECFAYLRPDTHGTGFLGIAGDGGDSFAELADRLDAGEPYHHLPGLVFQKGDEIITNGPQASPLQRPPRLEQLDMARYRQAGFGIGVVTKLENSYYPMDGDREDAEASRWRSVRPVDQVLQEVKEMHRRFGLQTVFFIDPAFNLPPGHATSLCMALIEAGLHLEWNTSLAPVPEGCDRDTLELMVRAGCSLVLMGGVALDGQDDAAIDSRFNAARDACRMCEEAGLPYTISQYFGEPGETPQSVEKKLDFLKGLQPAVASLRVGVRILPASRESQAALMEGIITDESQLIRPIFYLAESVKDWIADRLTSESADHSTWDVV